MSFRINRAEFLQILQRVEPGRSQRDFITQSSCFILGDSSVSTFNDEIFCHTRTGLPDEFAGAVAGVELLQAIDNMKDDDLTLDMDERHLLISANRIRVKVRLEREVVLPIENVTTPDRWLPLPEDFKHAVEQVCGIAGTDKNEFLTTCVHLNPGWIEASNRRQAIRHDLDWGITRPFLVRATSLAHVARLELVKIGETDEWVHFRNKSLVFSCRRHMEDYPDLSDVFDFRGSPAVLPKGAEVGAKVAGVFQGEDKVADKVLVKIKRGRGSGEMWVYGEGNRGQAEVGPLEMTYKGPDVTFRIPPVVLSSIVANYTECEILPEKLRVVGENWVFMSVLGLPDEHPSNERAAKPEPVAVGAEEGGDEDHRD